MTDQAAYRRYTAEAERFLAIAAAPQLNLTFTEPLTKAEHDQILQVIAGQGFDPQKVLINGGVAQADVSAPARVAQVYATLALAAAQERVQPADRPLPSPPVLIDRDGDRWLLDDEGRYVAELDRRDIRHREDVEAAYGPLREPGT